MAEAACVHVYDPEGAPRVSPPPQHSFLAQHTFLQPPLKMLSRRAALNPIEASDATGHFWSAPASKITSAGKFCLESI